MRFRCYLDESATEIGFKFSVPLQLKLLAADTLMLMLTDRTARTAAENGTRSFSPSSDTAHRSKLALLIFKILGAVSFTLTD